MSATEVGSTSPGWWTKLKKGRSMRKFRKDRMAMAALGVICVYLLVALSVVLGKPSKQDVFDRMGPDNVPGFWGAQDAEKRFDDAQFRLEQIDKAAKNSKAVEMLAAFQLGGLRAAPGTPSEVLANIASSTQLVDAVSAYDDLETDPAAAALLSELEESVASLFAAPTGFAGMIQSMRMSLGTDRQGRSIMFRSLYSTKVAVQIGIVAALFSVLLGTLLGAAAGYFGGWVDHLVVWLYSTFSSIPWIVLLVVLASMFRGTSYDGTLIPVYAAFCISFWISPCRVIRGEVMKLKELEYVQAASAIGYGRMRILLRHIIPNTAHLMFINFSLLFVGAIKAEVILSFLGLGVKNEPSWGVMISQAKAEVVNDFFWQIGSATFFMLVLVLAFNILSDALQDAFDPKHV
ncbi:MAG: peptide/nickel transport system permease protein [Candidatus Paceibacteria bacterium]|jgi:peptide/nickel transport system permease protein